MRIALSGMSCVLALLLALAGAGWTVAAQAADHAVIIMYHRFGENSIPSTNIRLDQFEAHLRELTSGKYNVVPLADIVKAFAAGQSLPDRTVAITVDDAYRSLYTDGWPRLKAAKLPLTVFIETEAIGRTGFLTWDQLRELARDGVTIGSQTVTHPHMPDLAPDAVARELRESRARIEQEIGVAPTLFAYPYGEASTAVIEATKAAGFIAAFGQHSGVAYASHPPFYQPRFAFNETFGGMDRFRMAINALPLKATDITPASPTLTVNPPAFGFTVDAATPNLRALNCFASHVAGPATLERLGANRIEIRVGRPFPQSRGRFNCTVPAEDGRFRWFGMQYYVPGVRRADE